MFHLAASGRRAVPDDSEKTVRWHSALLLASQLHYFESGSRAPMLKPLARRVLRCWPSQRAPWGCLVLVCCSNRPRTHFSRIPHFSTSLMLPSA